MSGEGGERRRVRRDRDAPRPQRVRVTSPRMAAVKRPPARPVTREIDEQTDLGEIYMRSLLKTQLRQGITALAVLVLVLGTMPLVFAAQPQLAAVRVLTVPLPWLLIGVFVYPFLVAVAWWTNRAAERTERDFSDLVGRR